MSVDAAPAPTLAPSAGSAPRTVTYHYRTGRVTVGIFYVLLGGAFLLGSMDLLTVTAGLFWPLLLIAVGAGTVLARARRLQVEEDRSAQLAVAEERVRIARELHDVVAHGVSLMTIQITAARRTAERNPDDAAASLLAAEQTGRQTLGELDSLLAVLRGADASIAAAGPWTMPHSEGISDDGQARAPLPRLTDVAALVDRLADAGRAVTLDVLGDPPEVPARIEAAVYRVVQEALTNAARYAPDAAVEVRLIYTSETITLFVDDDGPGASAPGRHGGGHGLLGMRERVATVGGTLVAGPRTPGPGWRVHASIPIFAISNTS